MAQTLGTDGMVKTASDVSMTKELIRSCTTSGTCACYTSCCMVYQCYSTIMLLACGYRPALAAWQVTGITPSVERTPAHGKEKEYMRRFYVTEVSWSRALPWIAICAVTADVLSRKGPLNSPAEPDLLAAISTSSTYTKKHSTGFQYSMLL